MIIGKRKTFDEIKQLIGDYQKVLNVGCGTCVAVCLAGGEKETEVLATELDMAYKIAGTPFQVDTVTVQRQCDMEYLAPLDDQVQQYDALLSMACGAGVQFLAERYPDKPVLPMVDTTFIGVNRAMGDYEERCRSCSSCLLGLTAGICPITMCSKSLFNGPCGGTNQGACEVDPDQPCAWYQIWERLDKQGRLDQITRFEPIRAHQNQVPRRLKVAGYQEPESEE